MGGRLEWTAVRDCGNSATRPRADRDRDEDERGCNVREKETDIRRCRRALPTQAEARSESPVLNRRVLQTLQLTHSNAGGRTRTSAASFHIPRSVSPLRVMEWNRKTVAPPTNELLLTGMRARSRVKKRTKKRAACRCVVAPKLRSKRLANYSTIEYLVMETFYRSK
jgi:hypothetical protein